MELAFLNQPYRFLRNMVQDVRFQEETAEIIVPDSYPDIAAIADCCAEAILRGKDCRDGSVTIAGGVKGVILYTPEDHSYPRNLEIYIPFSIKFEHAALTSQAQVVCTIRVRSVDARMINSRKAMLRVNLGCEITAYEDVTDVLFRLENDVPGLQRKEAVYGTTVPLETAEKSFSVNDAIELPSGMPTVSKIYEFHCHPELTDEKLVGNKAVFKGLLRCKMLYLSDQEELYLHEQTIPFSQYCELNTDYDEETVHTKLMVTGYDLETAFSDEGLQAPISVNILAQCVISGTHIMTLIEDAYSTLGTLKPQWKEYMLEGSLDQQSSTQTLRYQLSGEFSQILDTTVYWDYPEMARSMDKVEIKIPALIRVLGYDNGGTLQALTAKTSISHEIALSNGAACLAMISPIGEVSFHLNANGAEVRCSALLSVHCNSQEKLRTLCGGEIDTETNAADKRPSLIVRTVHKDTSLWDLAKTHGTTMEEIMAANHLDSMLLPDDVMLLLPIA